VSSALVRRVGAGDVLRLGPPVGHLALHEDSDRDLLLVAGGMGLAPLKALIDQVARKGPARRVDLFAGFRTEDQIYDRADLQRLQHENPWLTVTFAVSDDKVSGLEHGEIGDVLMRHGPWLSREVCVAGPAVMVEDTVARLLQSGLPKQRLSSEVFAPSRPGPSVDGEVTE
jgi:NAD(P)H-flavin reductase